MTDISCSIKATIRTYPVYCSNKTKHSTNKVEQALGIDYISSPISYSEFFINYLIPNKPCIFGKWLTANWLSHEKWVSEQDTLNVKHLKQEYGHCEVPVVNCFNTQAYDSHNRECWKAEKYFNYIQESDKQGELFYLKDWHFVREFPNHKSYTTPQYFASDWLNEFCDVRKKDDYRFVYIGPKNSWTPFHEDVLKSHSWSSNVCGKKKWIFLPPGAEDELRNASGQLPHDIRNFNLESIGALQIEQNIGESIFVPCGWHHQVHNMESTISINHNWMNASNIKSFWNFLQFELQSVKKEISDCKEIMSDEEFCSQCQTILKANIGMDYAKFLELCTVVIDSRIKILRSKFKKKITSGADKVKSTISNIILSPEVFICKVIDNNKLLNLEDPYHHSIFDILFILHVLVDFYRNADVQQCCLVKKCFSVISDIICSIDL